MESGGNGIVSALSTAFTSISSDLTSALTTILPIALGVLGMGIVIRYGIRWFQKITNKG